MIRILCIEDKTHHQKDAKQIFADKITKVEIDFATTYTDATRKLQSNVYHGVLSDVFLPAETNKGDVSILKSILVKARAKCYSESEKQAEKEMGFENLFQNEIPFGVLVGKYALERKWPIVFITDTYHHGKKTEPVNIWAKSTHIPLVDRDVNEESLAEEGLIYSGGNEEEYEKVKQHTFRKKDWLNGFVTLLWMIEGKKSGLVDITPNRVDSSLVFGWAGGLLRMVQTEEGWKSFGSEEDKAGFKKMVKTYFR